MAQSDWVASVGTSSAVLNSSLANPLPVGVGGSFCRLFQTDTVLTSNRPSLLNMPAKAVRMSICMRRLAGFSTGQWSGCRFKSTASRFTTSGNGYGITFTSGAEGVPVIKMNNTQELSLDGLPAFSFYNSNWIRLRLDVFPIGASGDQLFAYRETSIGSGVWDRVGLNGNAPVDGFFVASSDPRYAPWGTGNVFIETTNFSGNSYYFDQFMISTTNVT